MFNQRIIRAAALTFAPIAGLASNLPVITSPPDCTVVNACEPFSLSVFALSEGMLSPARLELYQDDVCIRVGLMSNHLVLDWTCCQTGLYTYVARAVYFGGIATTSSPVRIFISAKGAQAIVLSQFDANVILQGQASIVSNCVRLTPASVNFRGAAWLHSPQPIYAGFDSIFQFRIPDSGTNGADGLAFVLEATPTPTLGYAIGFGGVTNCLAVEFDTFRNPNHGDLNDNHISVHSRGTDANTYFESASLGWSTNIPNMSDGKVHTARVSYGTNELSVYVDDLVNPVLLVELNLAGYLNLNNGCAWVGFTAGTGAWYESHDILLWYYTTITPESPQIKAIQIQPDGSTRLRFSTLAGLHYAIQYSLNCADWRQASPLITGNGSDMQWIDFIPAEGLTQPQCFYRLQIMP